MDYKKLIEYLRTTAACGNYCYNCQRCMDAATAIEILLAERYAAAPRGAGTSSVSGSMSDFTSLEVIWHEA